MDWFTLFLVNAERGGNDSVPVKETKQQEGEGRAVSDDTSDAAPFHVGVGYALFLLRLLPKKAAHFPHNTCCIISDYMESLFYLILWLKRGREREGRNKEKRGG